MASTCQPMSFAQGHPEDVREDSGGRDKGPGPRKKESSGPAALRRLCLCVLAGDPCRKPFGKTEAQGVATCPGVQVGG